MKLSSNLHGKYQAQIDYLFALPWTMSVYDDAGNVLWRHRAEFSKVEVGYALKRIKDKVLRDGLPVVWDITRGRYKIEGTAGVSGELRTPKGIFKDGIMEINNLVVFTKGGK